ncbi:unnamed protein product, partial [Mesorhabditis spiculigera]
MKILFIMLLIFAGIAVNTVSANTRMPECDWTCLDSGARDTCCRARGYVDGACIIRPGSGWGVVCDGFSG